MNPESKSEITDPNKLSLEETLHILNTEFRRLASPADENRRRTQE